MLTVEGILCYRQPPLSTFKENDKRMDDRDLNSNMKKMEQKKTRKDYWLMSEGAVRWIFEKDSSKSDGLVDTYS